MRLGNCGRNLTMMLPDESEPAWRADFQEGLIVGFLIIGVLAIATGVLASTYLQPPHIASLSEAASDAA